MTTADTVTNAYDQSDQARNPTHRAMTAPFKVSTMANCGATPMISMAADRQQ